jgi:hypothetical protein
MIRPLMQLVICAVIGGVFVSGPAWLMPRRYVSTATFELDLYWPPSAGPPFAKDVNALWREIKETALTEANVRVIAGPGGAKSQRLRRTRIEVWAGLRYTPAGRDRQGVRESYCCFSVALAHSSPEAARALTQQVASQLFDAALADRIHDMLPHPAPCIEGGSCLDSFLMPMDPPSLPTRPTPDPLDVTTFGAVLGLIAGIVWEAGRKRGVS